MKREVCIFILICLVFATINIVNAEGSTTSIDNHGVILLNGEKFFPIGFWDLDLEGFATSGFEQYFPEMSKSFNSMIAIFPTNKTLCNERIERTSIYNFTLFRRGGGLGGANETNYCAKDYSLYLGWYIRDEPAWNGFPLSIMEDFYNTFRDTNTKNLLLLNHAARNTTEVLKEYNKYTDIISVDIYPTQNGGGTEMPNKDISVVGDEFEKIKQTKAREGQTFMIILQGFDRDNVKDANGLYRGISPNYIQTRFMAYHSIIHGAKGIYYFGMWTIPYNSPLWKNLLNVSSEIRSIEKILVSEDSNKEVLVSDKNVSYLLKKDGEYYYLFADNINAENKTVTFDIGNIFRNASVFEIFERRNITGSGEEFSDDFSDHEVHLYKLSPLNFSSQCNLSSDCGQNTSCSSFICKKGSCILEYKPDGTSCDDDVEITKNDICTRGFCEGVLNYPINGRNSSENVSNTNRSNENLDGNTFKSFVQENKIFILGVIILILAICISISIWYFVRKGKQG
jgi:hypothetical protein